MPRDRHDDADDRLRTYRAKRDFSITAEPEGSPPPPTDGRRFVVQRHRASQLHYDLRLEAGGVLVSWAVPKGPTLDPAARRLAVHVEDHPLDYYDFEGVIAAGEYGGGDVVVWDWGTWTLAEGADALEEIAAGDLHLALDGQKLRGRFALVRRGHDGRDQWLLIKKRDADAVIGWDPEDHPRSVKSGRTNDEVRDAPAAGWTGRASWAGATPDELEALDALGDRGSWSLGGHRLRLGHLDAVLVRGLGRQGPLTRRDLVRHHAVMAPAMLPYLADRPLDVEHHAGRTIPANAPSWLRRGRGGDAATSHDHVIADSAASLAWLANWGAIELRPRTSTIDEPRPTWALFDIRSDGAEPSPALEVARLHHTALEHLGMKSRAVVTAGGSIQIWVPIAPRHPPDHVDHWVATVSAAVRAAGGLDNAVVTTAAAPIAPFGVRAVPGAPVAVPVTWDELDDDDLRPDGWTVDSVGERLRRAGDPLAPLIGLAQRLPAL